MSPEMKKKRGRKPFEINKKNWVTVVDYLLAKAVRKRKADEQTYFLTHHKSIEQLTEWCQDRRNISRQEWQTMVRAIQKREERAKKIKMTKTVDLRWEAYHFLEYIAETYGHLTQFDDKVTLSQSVLILEKLYDRSGFTKRTKLTKDEIDDIRRVSTHHPKKK